MNIILVLHLPTSPPLMTQLQIIQTFFVSTISGTITSELTNILRNPESVVTFLANSLPGKSVMYQTLL